jgi:2-amino-4-hydroxy-6-hydroxymethyldihydropteridine diphosphokinase
MTGRSAGAADRVPPVPARVAVALGSNLGDRRRQLEWAVDRLRSSVAGLVVSSFHETAPVGVGEQPAFLNAAAIGAVTCSARDLLDRLLAIGTAGGRTRPFPGAPRTLDLDLILYDDLVVDEPGLVVPHPRFRDRLFVLAPLAEVAPALIDPVSGRSVRQLLALAEAGSRGPRP